MAEGCGQGHGHVGPQHISATASVANTAGSMSQHGHKKPRLQDQAACLTFTAPEMNDFSFKWMDLQQPGTYSPGRLPGTRRLQTPPGENPEL